MSDKDLEVDRIAAHVKKIVDAWPPLTEEQKSRIASLLRSGQTAGERPDDS